MRYYLQDEYNPNLCGCPDPQVLSTSDVEIAAREQAYLTETTPKTARAPRTHAKPSFFKRMQCGRTYCSRPKIRNIPSRRIAFPVDGAAYRGSIRKITLPDVEGSVCPRVTIDGRNCGVCDMNDYPCRQSHAVKERADRRYIFFSYFKFKCAAICCETSN